MSVRNGFTGNVWGNSEIGRKTGSVPAVLEDTLAYGSRKAASKTHFMV